MDLLNDTFFADTPTTSPLPEEDYRPNGKVKNVRGRILKKLLKYEFKYYLKPMLIAMSALFAVATTLCVLGCFLTAEDVGGTGELLRVLFWALSLLLFVFGALFVLLFPFILAHKRYKKQFFTSEGYLTLSIPASPQEHILAKRIAAYVMSAASSILVSIAVLVALIPIFVLSMKGGLTTLPPIQVDLNVGDVIYSLLQSLIWPLLLLALEGGYLCWQHRGLKKWMVALLVAGIYILSVFANIFLGSLFFELSPKVLNLIYEIGKWVLLAVEMGALYLLFLYETKTLQKKINLK